MNNYDINDEVQLAAEFRSLGVLADPPVVTLKVRSGLGVATTYVYGVAAIVKDSTGKYHFNLPITSAGSWLYRWEGSAAPRTANEGEFYVRASAF